MSIENSNTQQPAADAIITDAAVTESKRWGWKRISMYAGAAVVVTAVTYVSVKVLRKPKAVAAMADAASAMADAVAPAA